MDLDAAFSNRTVLATLVTGCNGTSWSCSALCAEPQGVSSEKYRFGSAGEATNRCTIDFGGSKCTQGFSCSCALDDFV